MDKSTIRDILLKVRHNQKLTKDEKLLLDNFYLYKAQKSTSTLDDHSVQKNLAQVESNLNDLLICRIKRNNYYWWSIAASIILVSTFIFLSINQKQKKSAQNEIAVFQAIKPLQNQITLTLSNGKTLKFHSGHILDLSVNPNSSAQKISPDQVNTITVPKGCQFETILSDGTKIWLNAESQLKYPSRFDTNNRQVELKGEAYFEVHHDKSRPFYVTSSGQRVKVLGTGFNVDSYDPFHPKTTLVHGKVLVENIIPLHKSSILLKPGEQAFMSSGKLSSKNIDANSVIAWKDGVFRFKKTNLQEIIYQLERWYDVRFEYKNAHIPKTLITGEIDRNVSLADFVQILAYFGVKCELKNKTVFLYN